MKSKIKLGVYSNTGMAVSETFIRDLIVSFQRDEDFSVDVFSGVNQPKDSSVSTSSRKITYTGFFSKGSSAFKLYSIGKNFYGEPVGARWKLKWQQYRANKRLLKFTSFDMDVAYVEYANTAVLLRPVFEKKGIPFLVHVHGYDITVATKDTAYLQELKKVFIQAKYIIAASHHIKRLLVLLGCDLEKIKVIRLGVDTSTIVPVPLKERQFTSPAFVYLGRLTPKKHPVALIYAFSLVRKEIPSAILTIIGEGSELKATRELIEQLKLKDSVQLLGGMDRQKAFEILKQHWIYVQHSVTAADGDQEGYALSIAEAAAHELAVVTTWHNGISEHVIDGETGYLVQEHDFERMADRMIQLALNKSEIETMGRMGRANIAAINDPNERYAKIKRLILDAKTD
jgi:colanic acid/amylovoran biosynthesis glycosyltransferase